MFYSVDMNDSLIELKWKMAIPKSTKIINRISGMIVGDEAYLKYVISHLPEDYEIVDPKK